MADICDFTDNDGRVSTANLNAAGTAFANGELTESELNTLDQANSTGSAVQQCIDGGGGGGGSVPSPPDTSELTIDSVEVQSTQPESISVITVISNNVVSGNGEELPPTLRVTVGDDQVFRSSLDAIPPSGTRTEFTDIQGLSPAEGVEVCASLV